jgi:AcrR family transcriptional regulator
MGRPRTFDRDDALEKALMIFWEHGYDRTSIAMLVNEIGIAAPSLYAAFGDKEQLFAEAARSYVSQTATVQQEALSRASGRDAVRALLSAAADQYTKAHTPSGCLVMSEPRLASVRDEGRAMLLTRLRRASAEGDLRDEVDLDALAEYLDTLLSGMAARARDGASRDQLESSIILGMKAWEDATPA